MKLYIKSAFIAVAATSALAVGSPANAGGKSETVATLSCLPVLADGAAMLGGCLAERHTVTEIAQCVGMVEGSCFGPNNEIRKAKRSLKRTLKKLDKKLRRLRNKVLKW